MRSDLLKQFGMPFTDCEVFADLDPHCFPRIWFEADGWPLVGLTLEAGQDLLSLLRSNNEPSNAQELSKALEKAENMGA